jgi:hypothetical protein
MLAIQEYISSFDNMGQALHWLKRKLGIVASEQSLAGRTLIQFSVAAGSEDHISRESDGLILNTAGEVVCLPPLRPIRLKEEDESKVVWKDAIVSDKEEGLRVMVYYFNDMWTFATPRSINALDSIKIERNITSTIRFEISHKLNTDFGSYGAVFDYPDNEDLCFIFNYTWPLLDCIHPPKKEKLILETIVDRKSFLEVDPFLVDDFAHVFGFERPLCHTINEGEEKEIVSKLMRPYTVGLNVHDIKGNKYFLPNRLYTALYITKVVGINVLPVHVLNVMKHCRTINDINIVKEKYKKMVPVIDILDEARQSLIMHAVSALQGKTNTDKPGAVVKMEAEILEAIKRLLKGNEIDQVAQAVNALRPDKIIAYAAATKGQQYFSAVEKLREGER